jgi:hypothetical protein
LQKATTQTEQRKNGMSNHPKPDQRVEALIANAMKKVGAKKENDICRYLPGPKGGYIHHFSMRKMKYKDPEQLMQTINKNIILPVNPSKLPPKPRAPRGSRKRKDNLSLSKQDIDLLLFLARQSGQKEIIRKLTPRKDLKSIKRELIASIKHGHVKEDLWLSYVESIASLQQTNNTQHPQTIPIAAQI